MTRITFIDKRHGQCQVALKLRSSCGANAPGRLPCGDRNVTLGSSYNSMGCIAVAQRLIRPRRPRQRRPSSAPCQWAAGHSQVAARAQWPEVGLRYPRARQGCGKHLLGWGHAPSPSRDPPGRPRRRLAKGTGARQVRKDLRTTSDPVASALHNPRTAAAGSSDTRTLRRPPTELQ